MPASLSLDLYKSELLECRPWTSPTPSTRSAPYAGSLSTLDHRGQPARALTAEQTYDAPATDVWDALTNAGAAARAGSCPVEGDLRVGGRYQLVGNAGGTVERCDPPRSLAVTWEYGDLVSWVEVDLAEADGATTLVLRHIAHPDERWERYGPGAVGIGWDMSMLGLALHLATGEDNDADAFMTWSTGEDGPGVHARQQRPVVRRRRRRRR